MRPSDHGARLRHFIFTDEHDRLRESIHACVVKELRPHADESKLDNLNRIGAGADEIMLEVIGRSYGL